MANNAAVSAKNADLPVVGHFVFIYCFSLLSFGGVSIYINKDWGLSVASVWSVYCYIIIDLLIDGHLGVLFHTLENIVHFSPGERGDEPLPDLGKPDFHLDRKSTRLNSSHQIISYAVFCLKKK